MNSAGPERPRSAWRLRGTDAEKIAKAQRAGPALNHPNESFNGIPHGLNAPGGAGHRGAAGKHAAGEDGSQNVQQPRESGRMDVHGAIAF
jgi:hypothetical protein